MVFHSIGCDKKFLLRIQTWRVSSYFQLEQIVFDNLVWYKRKAFLQCALGNDLQAYIEHQNLSYIADNPSSCNYLLNQNHWK